ncbi:hypothetical protein GCM10009760_22580 [Kitasatospora kazusensis]|uniref:Uncharacterized protein n=1 Tax=Kitasatospora kazusensis TaxID=407974 RepID=A0ABN2ZBV3_9ACTN
MATSTWGRAALGTLRFALVAFACLGILAVLLWSLSWQLFDFNGPDPLDTTAYDAYLDIGLAWAIGIGIAGIVGSFTLRPRGARSSLGWLACCDLGLALAVLWPVQAVALALLFAARAGKRSRWLRGSVALAGVAVLAVGGTWGFRGHEAEQPWDPDSPAATALVGTWTGPGGQLLELQPDGHYRTTTYPGDPAPATTPQPPSYLTGTWKLTALSNADTPRTVVLDGAAIGLDVYGALSPTTLCEPQGPDFCDVALHRTKP